MTRRHLVALTIVFMALLGYSQPSRAVLVLQENFDALGPVTNGLLPTTWTRSSTADISGINRRPGFLAGGINQGTGNAGFDSFFNTNPGTGFAVLGDVVDGISGLPVAGNFSLTSPSFTLATASKLTISFRSALDGIVNVAPAEPDLVTVALIGSSSQTTIYSATFSGSQINAGTAFPGPPATFTLFNVAAGTYQLRLSLAEGGTGVSAANTNTALGVDDVSVTSDVVPVPAALWMFLAGLGVLYCLARQTA